MTKEQTNFAETIARLKAEYQKRLAQQAAFKKADLYPAVVEKRADYEYQQQGLDFQKMAGMALKASTDWKIEAAMAAAKFLKSQLAKAQTLKNRAAYYEGFKEVDEKRMVREANQIEKGLTDDVYKFGHEHGKNRQGEAHQYKVEYHETQEYGKASTLKHEPEDLEKVFSSIEGVSITSRLADVLGDKTPKEMEDEELIAYATEKAHGAGQKNALAMTIGEIEQYALADAKKARMVVEMKKIQTAGQKVMKRQKTPEEERLALIQATRALTDVNDELNLKQMHVDEHPQLSPFIEKLDLSKATIGDLRENVKAEGKKRGMEKVLTMVEKQERNVKRAQLNALKGKKKVQNSAKQQEGGRRMGESRPGAKSWQMPL